MGGSDVDAARVWAIEADEIDQDPTKYATAVLSARLQPDTTKYIVNAIYRSQYQNN